MMSSLSVAADSMQGSLHGKDCEFDGVSTDSRTLKSGELFFALSGPNFDGRDYVERARHAGAGAAVVTSELASDLAQIVVDDTRLALGRLGAFWRREQQAVVVGITGSNGKTTLKEMTAACLRQSAPTIATRGNLNNEIGMPLMLTRIEPSHRFAVIEMGANHAGEIAYLTSLAQPNVVVISNAAAAHLEGFGSIEGVANAKGEILGDAFRPDTAILNADDEYFDYWASLVTDIELLSFGLGANADVYADDIDTMATGSSFMLRAPDASVSINLPLVGVHNVRNACAAAAVSLSLDIPIEKIKIGLEAVAPVDGRLKALPARNGATLFDDSYNANPLSVTAAAEFLATLAGLSWVVLGDMGELGDNEQELHGETGRAIRDAGVDRLFATGELSRRAVEAFGDGASWYASRGELTDALIAELTDDVNVLVKGSRFMQMERIVDALREEG